MNFGIWEWNVEDDRVEWDTVVCRLFGREADQWRGTFVDVERSILQEDRQRVRNELAVAHAAKRDFSMSFRIVRPGGVVRVVRSESKIVYGENGDPIQHIGVCWDMTDLKEQEMRVFHASKMSSLGEMSAGIAHEINNPLAIIAGKADSIRRAMSTGRLDDESLLRHLGVIEKTTMRIAKIVKSLRAFSRDGEFDPFELSKVGEIVSESATLSGSRFLNYGIDFRIDAIDPALEIQCRPIQISQVLLNLLNNAFDAVLTLDEKWVRIETRVSESEIELRVIDSGKGIPVRIREKILQPFFTTKEVGVGTGLGLSISMGIVQAHNGSLFVDAECENTCFVVRLPIKQEISAQSVAQLMAAK
jgi:signal transduction histidine kinase